MSKGQQQQQPDWAKFGLEPNERQPLNPQQGQPPSTTAAAATATPPPAPPGKSSPGDVFGSQVQGANELFADDQGSVARPWWHGRQFLVSERVLFGTWDGVFTSCLINIFGVIVFLRSGWIVAEAGIASSSLIVLAAVVLILISVLSAIGICERCKVQSGGVYFLIAHVLGSRRGAAVGIIYVLGQAIGNALCATGFGESIAGVISDVHHPIAERAIAAIVIIFLTLVNLAEVKWVIRLQFILLVILLLGAGDFAIGSFTHSDPESGFMGWNSSVWVANARPNYTEEHNWFSVFGVFFPALTGVMAGINMSGDLRNPSQDISVGTLSAVGVGSMLYLMFMMVLAGTCDRAALFNDYMIAEKVSALGFLLLSALYISSISSCLATLYGTPRVLQSIASENVIPAMAKLAEGRGPNKVPQNALLVISGISLVFIAIGEMNRLATLATMPFLITYAVIEYAYFVLCMQFDINQQRLQKFRAHGIPSPTFDSKKAMNGNANDRKGSLGTTSSIGSGDDAASVDSRGELMPERRMGRDDEFEELLARYNVDEIEEKPKTVFSALCNRWLSITGFVIKLVMMFLIHWGYSLLCIGLCAGIWFYIGPGTSSTIASNGGGGGVVAATRGVAAEFSILDYAKSLAARLTGGRVEIPEEKKLVIQPTTQPALDNMTRPSRMNEVNSDFADRSQFHQAHTVQGSHFND